VTSEAITTRSAPLPWSVRHRRLIIFAFLAGLAGALIYLLAPPLQYQYTTDVFLGETLVGDNVQPIDNGNTVLAIVRDSILPSPDSSLQEMGISGLDPYVLVMGIENGRAVRLRSEAREGDVDQIKAMHRFIADRILAHLQRREMFIRSRAEGRRKGAEQSLEVAGKAREFYSAGLAQTNADESKLAQAIQELAAEIAKDDKAGSDGAALVGDGLPRAGANTFALGKRGQLAMYQSLRLSDLPTRQIERESKVIEADRLTAEMEQRIRDLTLELATLDPPRITRFAERSVNPAGPRKLVRLMVGFFVGAMLYLGVWVFVTLIRSVVTGA
jgi:hypothetical protein